MALFNELGFGVPQAAVGTKLTFGTPTGRGQEGGYGFPDPNVNFYNDVLGEINSVVAINKNYSTKTPTLTQYFTGAASYIGAVLAPNGKIYGIPYNATSVLEIDPNTKVLTTFGTVAVGSAKYFGGTLAGNGKIYAAGFVGTSNFLEIDPNKRIVSTFAPGSTATGYGYAAGAIVLPDGTLIFGPDVGGAAPNGVLQLNPFSRVSTKMIQATGSTFLPQSVGIILHPNGKAYCCPQTSNTILEIDYKNKKWTTFGGPLTPTNGDWNGSVLGPDGKIYMAPVTNPSSVLVVDPYTKTVSYLGSFSGTNKYRSGFLGPNGNIYILPATAGNIIQINPFNKTLTTFGSFTTSDMFGGVVMAMNGKAYAVPNGSGFVLEIDFSQLQNFSKNLLLSTYLNHI